MDILVALLVNRRWFPCMWANQIACLVWKKWNQTFAFASRLASASAAIALWRLYGSRTSFTSTLDRGYSKSQNSNTLNSQNSNTFGHLKSRFLSTAIPHGFVALSRIDKTSLDTCSRSDKIPDRVLVPKMFLSVVWASIRVEEWTSLMFWTEAFENLSLSWLLTDPWS